MKKQMKIHEIRNIVTPLLRNWESLIGELKLSTKEVYKVIKLKRELLKHAESVDETLAILMRQVDAEEKENGTFVIPEQYRAEVAAKMEELNSEVIDIEYQEINVTEKDTIPPLLIEYLFDFIKVQ